MPTAPGVWQRSCASAYVSPMLIGGRIVCHPFGGLALHGQFIRRGSTIRAHVINLFHLKNPVVVYFLFFMLIAQVLPYDFMILSAMWALGAPALHGTLVVAVSDGACPFDGGGADLHSLCIVESCLPGHSQFPGVTLIPRRFGPAVAFVAKNIADGLRGQGVGFGGAA